jgi:hypothetical protein
VGDDEGSGRDLLTRRWTLAIVGGVVVIVVAAVLAVSLTGGSHTSTPARGVAQRHAAAPGGGPTPPGHVIPRKTITVSVLNGTTVTGLAGRTSKQLAQQGFDTDPKADVATASDQAQRRTSVVYSNGFRLQAREVARSLKVRSVHPISASQQNALGERPSEVVVVVGSDHAAKRP